MMTTPVLTDASCYIGLMSGTSLDCIDAVLVQLQTDGTMTILATQSVPIVDALRQKILALNAPCTNDLARSLALDVQMGELLAQAVLSLLSCAHVQPAAVRAIGSHGQTLRHEPLAAHPYSHQIGNAAIIAERTGITTVYDFRMRDIAAGGQGAPLASAFHRAVLKPKHPNDCVIINIGGMSNVTLLQGASCVGFDTGPGNVLMNAWVHKHRGTDYDENGAWASSGNCLVDLLQKWLAHDYFKLPPPKSTGRELFSTQWLDKQNLTQYDPADVQATLMALTAQTIVDAIPNDITDYFVCGGGAHNGALLDALAAKSGANVNTTASAPFELSPDWVEAVTFAWLAMRTLDGQANNCPEVTGASGLRVLGSICPGALHCG